MVGSRDLQKGAQGLPVVRVMEIVGESDESFQKAVQNAVTQAARKTENISGVEVANWTANVKAGSIVEYKADVRVAYAEDA